MEQVITRDRLPVTLVKNNYNITQHLVRTTNFLATVSTLSMDLRNDGAHRRVIPMTDPEFSVQYHIACLKASREKTAPFFRWAQEVRQAGGAS